MVGDFVCNVCGKQFIAKRALYLHMRGVHTEVEVPCNDCDKIFKSKTKLEYHTRATHQEKNSFYCDVKVGDTRCIYYSATKSNLRAHKKRMHEKTLPNPPELVCGSCDYRTNRKNTSWWEWRACGASSFQSERIWTQARVSHKWQKDDDPDSCRETAKYDGAS